MEIENSNTIDDFQEDGFVIDPVDIILPASASTGYFKRLTKKVVQKKSQAPPVNEKTQAIETQIANKIINFINATKEEILSAKIIKTCLKVWRNINFKNAHITPFNIIKIGMPTNYETILLDLYESFHTNKPMETQEYSLSIINIDQQTANLRDLIDSSISELQAAQENLGNNARHLVVLLFNSHFTLYEGILDDYMQYLTEEFLPNAGTTKFYMIFPSITPQTQLRTLNTEIIEVEFTRTKKLVFKLLIELITKKEFFPFLSSKDLVFLLHDLDYMDISFERIIQKVHLLVQDYIYQVSTKNQGILMMIEAFINMDIDTNTYLQLKKQVRDAVTIFCAIEQKVFNVKGKAGEKILSFLMKNDIVYSIPPQAAAKIDSLEEAAKVCNEIEMLIASSENEAFKSHAQMFAKLKTFEGIVNLKKTKTKEDKRLGALLSKGKTTNETIDDKEKLAIAKERICHTIKLFLKECLLGTFSTIETKYRNLVYLDIEELRRLCYGDILGKYCESFKVVTKALPRKEVPIVFSILQDFNLRVDTVQSYEAFLDLYKKHNPKMTPEEMDQAFYVALNELKWMGLVSETRKSKISFEKNFFAKCIFRRVGHDPEDADEKEK